MVMPDCHKLRRAKWQRLSTLACMVKIQMAKCPTAWSWGERLTFESEIVIIRGFLVIFSVMRILHVWYTFFMVFT